MGAFIGIFVAVIVILSIVGIANSAKKAANTIKDSQVWKEERNNGNIVRRDNMIWKEEERFFSKSTYELLREKIKTIDTAKMGVEVIPDYEGEKLVVFKGKGFVATLKYIGNNGGKNEFVFCYPAYNTPVGTYLPGMNYVLTITEKAFLELDPATMTETHALQYKTERKWVI